MQKEQIQEFISKITLSNRTGLTVVTYEILFVYLDMKLHQNHQLSGIHLFSISMKHYHYNFLLKYN